MCLLGVHKEMDEREKGRIKDDAGIEFSKIDVKYQHTDSKHLQNKLKRGKKKKQRKKRTRQIPRYITVKFLITTYSKKILKGAKEKNVHLLSGKILPNILPKESMGVRKQWNDIFESLKG